MLKLNVKLNFTLRQKRKCKENQRDIPPSNTKVVKSTYSKYDENQKISSSPIKNET